MEDVTLHLLLVLGGMLFSTGGFYVYVKLSLARLKEDAATTHQQIRSDVNNIGRKVGNVESDMRRRHNNVSLVLMLVAPTDKEEEICSLLKEA
jgi:uncharacterized protein YneF (UPF0154 family)